MEEEQAIEKEEGDEEESNEFDEEDSETEEIDVGKNLWTGEDDKETISMFHSQTENARKNLISNINEFNKWIDEREGLKDLPNVRMAINIHNQIKNLVTCFHKENQILMKIKNKSISSKNNEISKQKTKYEKRIRILEGTIEKLKEKQKLKPPENYKIEVYKRKLKGEKQKDIGKDVGKDEHTISSWIKECERYYKKNNVKNFHPTEKTHKNIENQEKLNKGETNGTGEKRV